MVGIARLVEICLVASDTCIWCIVIIIVMATVTIIYDGQMRVRQDKIIVMDREGSRFPARYQSMTGGTCCRDSFC